jgi:hypothetical protein
VSLGEVPPQREDTLKIVESFFPLLASIWLKEGFFMGKLIIHKVIEQKIFVIR